MSIIEVMISLVAGLIVAGAALAFTLSTLSANADFIGATRLTQELRTTMTFVSDELRRAGYDEDAMTFLARPASFTGASPFAPMFISAGNDCVIYAYDRLPGVPGQVELSNGEIRAIRRAVRNVNGANVGVIEFAESAGGLTPSCTGNGPDYTTYPPSCNGGSGWCALSDPTVIDIQTFIVQNDLPANGVIAGSATTLPLQMRRVNVDIRGVLRGQPDVVRGMRERIRVRADCVRPNAGTSCTVAPTSS